MIEGKPLKLVSKRLELTILAVDEMDLSALPTTML